MIDLFASAPETKKSAKAATANDMIVINDATFHTAVHRLAEVISEQEALEAEEKILSATVKDRSIEEFCKIYDKTGTYPGSFDIEATGAKGLKNAAFKAIPVDRYINIDEDGYNFLSTTYGNEIVEKNTVYTLNTKLIEEKYGAIISKLIMNSKDIADEDKIKLISKSTTFSVKKGTIKNLKAFVTKKVGIAELVANILPIFQKKNVRILS